jgi:formylglycine-generating enzyme required for sulfatase activity
VPATDPCTGPVTVSFPSRCAAPLTAAQERELEPKDGFRECENCPEMVVVPAGAFTMGARSQSDLYDVGPPHTVTIGRPFAVGKLHVTVDQFAAFVRETRYSGGSRCQAWDSEGNKWIEHADRSWRNPGFAQDGSHPVVCMNWNDAKAYADWLAKKTGRPYRLLSEAEWEYAAHGRTSPGAYPLYWFGNAAEELCRYANGADQKARDTVPGKWSSWFSAVAPCNDGYTYTSPAGHYSPNAFGLYDMIGNAEQWTADCRHDGYNGAPVDGSSWPAGNCSYRMTRGGSWMTFASLKNVIGVPGSVVARTSLRQGFNSYTAGFRVARTLAP